MWQQIDREWGALRAYAAERGVRILGDVAIYVSPGGCDHRLHPELFQSGLVAGAPPDAYSRSGQLWGNPLYDWPALQRRGYRWWVERVRRTPTRLPRPRRRNSPAVDGLNGTSRGLYATTRTGLISSSRIAWIEGCDAC